MIHCSVVFLHLRCLPLPRSFSGDPASLTGLGILLSRRSPTSSSSSSTSSSASGRDVDNALAYFEKAAKKGYMEAFYQMGMLHLELGEEAGEEEREGVPSGTSEGMCLFL